MSATGELASGHAGTEPPLTATMDTSSTANYKKPMVRRVPAPRYSQIPPATEVSTFMSRKGSSGFDNTKSTKNARRASSMGLETLTSGLGLLPARSDASTSSVPDGQFPLKPSAPHQPVPSLATLSLPPSAAPLQRQFTPARPPMQVRSSSGGAKLAAFASKLGTSAQQTLQRVATTTQNATQTAAAAVANVRSGSPLDVSPRSTNDTKTAGSFREKGANIVMGAAARLGRNGKGRDRAALAYDSSSSAGNSPRVGGASPNLSNSSPEGEQQSRFNNSAIVARRPSISSKLILGVRVPSNRAGEVFGAPIRVAADRTKLAEKRVIDIPGAVQEETERRREASKVMPAIAVRCLDYLNEYGKTEEGLYRIPGSTNQVKNLRTIFDSGEDIDLLGTLSTSDLEPSAVASTFKLWLRELPEPLLHSLEHDIEVILAEHTGNAASAQATTTQPVGGLPSHASTSSLVSGGIVVSPLVVGCIRDLFAASLSKEHVILLREICYHLAHLATFSSITKMTFSNLQLILSPTLKLSPIMLSILVNEREQIFPRPGQLDLSAEQHKRPSQLSLFSSTGNSDLSLSYPTAGPPTIPMPEDLVSRPPPTISLRPSVGPGLRQNSYSGTDHTLWGAKLSSGQPLNYRASWHMVEFPKVEEYLKCDDGEFTSTPIAKKFLHQRTASASNLFDRSRASSNASSISPGNGSPLLQRTPTMTGRSSPSPFFSAGAPPAGLGFMSAQTRKRGSAASMQSTSPTEGSSMAIPEKGKSGWRSHRRVSSQSSLDRTTVSSPTDSEGLRDNQNQDEEEELSSSDTNTSVASSVSSTATPKDSFEIDRVSGMDVKRTTITAETYDQGASGYTEQQKQKQKKKRGSMMLLSMLDIDIANTSERDNTEYGGNSKVVPSLMLDLDTA